MVSATVYFNESLIGHCLASTERVRPTMTESWLGAPKQRTATVVWGVCVCVCVTVRECERVCASVRECARVCACVRPCMRACVRDVFAIYDDNILSRLIMIIIKISILCFIHIRHTDDFPSGGIPASNY